MSLRPLAPFAPLAPLALTLVLALTGCSGDDPAVEDTSTSDTKGTTTADPATSDGSMTSTTAATTDATGTSTTSGTTGETTGCSFIDCGTGGTPTQCDPGKQDCIEGEKCTPYLMTPGGCCVDALKCVPDTGDKKFGEKCTRTDDNDDCDVGFFCMTKTSGSTGEGICLQLCDVNNAASCEIGSCIGFNDGLLPLCEQTCDPLLQDCIGEDVGCYLAAGLFICAQSGYDEGKGSDGDACYTVQSCKPGLICVNGPALEGCNGERCCTPVCDLSMGGVECSAPTEMCVAVFAEGEAPPQWKDVGLCLIPE